MIDLYNIYHSSLVVFYFFPLTTGVYNFHNREEKDDYRKSGLLKISRNTVKVNYGLFLFGNALRIIVFILFIEYHNGVLLNGSILFMFSKFTSSVFITGLCSVSLMIGKIITRDKPDTNEFRIIIRFKNIFKSICMVLWFLNVIALLAEVIYSPNDAASIDYPTSLPQLAIQIGIAINYLFASVGSLIFLKTAFSRRQLKNKEDDENTHINQTIDPSQDPINLTRDYIAIGILFSFCFFARSCATIYTAFVDQDPFKLMDLIVYPVLEILPITILFLKLNEIIFIAGSFKQANLEEPLIL